MVDSLAKKSDILKIKYKFFLNRVVIYFSFLLIPLWLQKTIQLNLFFQSLVLGCYMIFMGGQWYLLGKEIDHRLKIYYKANSTMDRFLYRILMGNIVVMMLFNLISYLPANISEIIFWTFFTFLGLFYSWPTRGKIIEDSMSDQFSELRFLDSFEKMVLYMSVAMFLVSLPEIPLFQNIEALKLYFDPKELIHIQQWNFLKLNYLPFMNYSKLYNLAWSYHFYFYGLSFYLIAIYGILRFFVSRRLSILGVFAAISTWSMPKLLDADFISIFTTTYPVIWIWAMLWSAKSSTYRSGLFVGMLNYLGSIIHASYVWLYPIQLLLTYFVFLPDKTKWYKMQWLKYNIVGGIFAFTTALTHFETSFFFNGIEFNSLINMGSTILSRKAFYSLFPLGLIIFLMYIKLSHLKYFKSFTLDKQRLIEISIAFVALLVMGVSIEQHLISDFSLIWFFVFFSLIPLEWIFQSISRLRSKRNIIYAMYILVCLLDSHFEGRLRIIGKMFLDDEVLKYINQM